MFELQDLKGRKRGSMQLGVLYVPQAEFILSERTQDMLCGKSSLCRFRDPNVNGKFQISLLRTLDSVKPFRRRDLVVSDQDRPGR